MVLVKYLITDRMTYFEQRQTRPLIHAGTGY